MHRMAVQRMRAMLEREVEKRKEERGAVDESNNHVLSICALTLKVNQAETPMISACLRHAAVVAFTLFGALSSGRKNNSSDAS